nr:hypothetical protein [uncultured Neokomagataea sp.]
MSAVSASGVETVVSHARPWIVRINGHSIHNWTSCEVGRDLADIAGTFRVDLAEPFPFPDGFQPTARIHDRVEIEIENQIVFRGFVEAVNTSGDEHSFHVTISGRDTTGDLVDCSVNPNGPAEYRKILLETVIGSLIQPYGVSLQRQVETGAPFTLVALEPQDTVLAAVERLSRQRGILVTSDGIGGIVLTKAGTTRATDRLIWPGGNVSSMQTRLMQRHSDTWVKGQFNSVLRGSKAALNIKGAPQSQSATGHRRAGELAASARFGHAIDPGVGRYRPVVHLAKTQSGGSAAAQNSANPSLDATALGQMPTVPAQGAYRSATVHHRRRKARKPRTDATPWTLQDQADWRMRTARAHATAFVYTVPGLLNKAGDLWQPNSLVSVQDAYNQLDGDMLIGAVTWVAKGTRFETRISVVPPDAYDLTGDADAPSRSGGRRTSTGRAFGR